MCGICGILSSQPVNEFALKRMTRALSHRGPDDEGYFFDTHVGLGMRRLSIIDLDTGQQPVTNETENMWLVFNGEIYNFKELRCALEKRGHIFRSQSDTEVIIHAYEEYGQHCVDHFNGMFAFAIWDTSTQQLFLARDRLGIKPLYYTYDKKSEQLIFASEIKAIVTHPSVKSPVDPVALDHFLTLEYIPAPRTIYRDIQKLPAGHCLTFRHGQLSVKQYWEIARHAPTIAKSDSIEQLTELIEDAVRLRLVSDVPLGAFLSGGIDSSTIVATMSRLSNSPTRTFSIGFNDPTYNELPHARQIATQFGTDHHQALLQPTDLIKLIEPLVRHFDEPFGDFSIFPTYLVSKLAGDSVKVVLSGDGGDEIFGGYETYQAQQIERYYRWLPASVRQKMLPVLLDRLPPQSAKKGVLNKMKRFAEGAALPGFLQHTRWMMFMNPTAKNALYGPELQANFNGNSAAEFMLQEFHKAASWDTLAQQQVVDVKTYLAENILTKLDRMTMAASIEARVPLLDHRLVEFALNLPSEMKLNGRQSKLILRQAMRDRLPNSTLSRAKQGFSIPLKHWLRGALRPMMTDLLSPSVVQQRGYFQPDTVTRWVTEHLEQRANHSHRLWALMVFELWQQAAPQTLAPTHSNTTHVSKVTA